MDNRYYINTIQTFDSCLELVQDIYNRYMNTHKADASLVSEVNNTLAYLNGFTHVNALVGTPPTLNALSDDFVQILNTIAQWIIYAKIILSPLEADYVFIHLITEISTQTYDSIFSHIKQKYLNLSTETRNAIEEAYKMNWSETLINEEEGSFTIIERQAKGLHEHWKDILWLYSQLSDYRSRKVLTAAVNKWYNWASMARVNETLYDQYFDADIIRCEPDEVYVDMGTLEGNSIIGFIKYHNSYKRIYGYEITPAIYDALVKNTQSLPNMELRHKGVSDKKGCMYLAEEHVSGSNKLSAIGTVEVETVAIDEDITEPVTFIKIDVEGSDQAALRGSEKHIQASKPKLAVALYHKTNDLWEIPQLIESIQPGYQFYMRYYGYDYPVLNELILYAV
jgi:FkbM family methyltransferase